MAARDLVDKPITLDENLAQSLEKSTNLVLGQFFGLPCKFLPAVRGRAVERSSDLSGVVSIFQNNVHGVMALGFPKEMVFQLMGRIYRKEFSAVEQAIIDGVGEITNSVYGQIKRDMNERGYDLQMAIPSVIVGRGHSLMPYTNRPTLMLPVETELGNFHASIILENAAPTRG